MNGVPMHKHPSLCKQSYMRTLPGNAALVVQRTSSLQFSVLGVRLLRLAVIIDVQGCAVSPSDLPLIFPGAVRPTNCGDPCGPNS